MSRSKTLSPEEVLHQKEIIKNISLILDEEYKITKTTRKAFVETYGCQQNESLRHHPDQCRGSCGDSGFEIGLSR